MRRHAPRLAATSLTILALVGCDGVIADPGNIKGSERTPVGPDGRTPAGLCATVGQPGLLRLSEHQYRNTLRDLLGPTLGPEIAGMAIYPETAIESGFSSDAEANTVNTAESNAIEDNAELLANHLLSRAGEALPQLVPCVPSSFADADIDRCIDELITDFGLRAHRRPLTVEERAIARDLYDGIRAEQSAPEAWSAVMQLFLQSPALLYRTERGEGPVEGAPELLRLTDYEIASRLSYLFLDSMPDAQLFEAAAAGELETPEQVEAQARRLLDDPRAFETLARFHREWLRLYHLDDAMKDPEMFPEFDAATRAAMARESDAFLRWVLEEGGGDYHTLMTTPALPVAPELAAIYGTEAGTPAVPNRAGLLTTAAFAATHARANGTHPIERGAFFRREILCSPIPAFPGGIDTAGPLESSAHLPTARERLAPLLERPDCSGCHTLFNPIGLAFESYDAIGRWRDTENGAPIDTSGEIAIGDAQGAFDTPSELIDIVARSEQGQGCYATQALRFALGRRESGADTCSLEALKRRFIESGGDIRELMIAITQTESFLYRPATEAGR